MKRVYLLLFALLLGFGLAACDVSIEPLNQNWKDWLQAGSWVFTGVGGLVAVGGVVLAALRFTSELRAGREQRVQELRQREQELRWKQAEVGRSLREDMLRRSAWSALQMLDNEGDEFEVSPGERVTITYQDIQRALEHATRTMEGTTSDPLTDKTDKYICKCFDDLFYVMDLFQHYTDTTLIRHEDIAVPFDYYMPKLAKLRPVVDGYLSAANVGHARDFLEKNYEPWKGVDDPGNLFDAYVAFSPKGPNTAAEFYRALHHRPNGHGPA